MAVNRKFAGEGLVKDLFRFATNLAKENGIKVLRLDTEVNSTKLRHIYEKLGFKVVKEIQEDYRKTAFYQKHI